MIEPMKKISLFIYYREKNKVLRRLQKLGLLHLEYSDWSESASAARLQKELRRHQHTVETLEVLSREICDIPQSGDAAASVLSDLPELPGPELISYIDGRIAQREELREALEELARDEDILRPWGQFSLGLVDQLRARGVSFRFFVAATPVFRDFDFGSACVEVIRQAENKTWFLILDYNGHHSAFPLTGKDTASPDVDAAAPQQAQTTTGSSELALPFEEVDPPRRSLEDIRGQRRQVEIELGNIEQELLAMTRTLPRLRERVLSLRDRLSFELAREGLGGEENQVVRYIQGWLPARRAKAITSYLDEHHISYILEKPERGDDVPVLLKNRTPNRRFEAITKIFSLPDYYELDPTPFFAPFFLIFFGLCLGDVGYGAVLLAVAGLLLAIGGKKKKPGLRVAGWLGLILGASTVVNGLFLNTLFGATLFPVPGTEQAVMPESSGLTLFAAYNVDGKTVFPAMTLSLFLGFVQLLFGGGVKIFNNWFRLGAAHALPPLGFLMVTFSLSVLAVHSNPLNLGITPELTIGPLPVGSWLAVFPALAGQAGLIGGLALVFLFNNPGSKIWTRPLTGIWEVYQFATALMGDLLSYIRLFALGLASGLLGNAFNYIGLLVLPGGPENPEFGSVAIIAAALIWMVGHTLNFGLSVLGAFVHSLRLTFVEFYKAIDFQGGGRPFRAFRVIKTAGAKS